MKSPRRRQSPARGYLPPPQPAAQPVPAQAAGAARGFRQVARSRRQTQRAAAAALWTLVISGPLLGLAAFAEHAPSPHAAAAPAATTDATGAAGVAELFLEAYLAAGQGSEASVRVYYPAFPDLAQASGQRQAEAVAVLSARTTSPGVVTVLLAAHVVAAASGGGWADEGWHYYQIAMAAPAAGGYLALELPAEIQAPTALASAPNSGYNDSSAPTSGTPLSAAVAQFLQAYLTGNGVVSRYTTTGSTLAAITPAPYASVQLTDLATDATSSQDEAATVPAPGTSRHVLATVTAVDALGHNYTLAYPLTLVSVAGQWEVASLAPAPVLAAAPAAGLASPGAAAGSTFTSPAAAGTAAAPGATPGSNGVTP